MARRRGRARERGGPQRGYKNLRGGWRPIHSAGRDRSASGGDPPTKSQARNRPITLSWGHEDWAASAGSCSARSPRRCSTWWATCPSGEVVVRLWTAHCTLENGPRSPRASAEATSGTAVTRPRSTRAWRLPTAGAQFVEFKIASVGVINVAAS